MSFFIAIRNLVLQRKRYLMIGVAVMLGFALITVISGASYGAMETIKSKAARYFSGHVSITGYSKKWPHLEDPDAIASAIRMSNSQVKAIARRTIYYNSDALLIFGGETVRQRRLLGIDFDAEKLELTSLTFSSGSAEAMLGSSGSNGILISDFAAKILGARIGDDVNLALTTDTGQYSTSPMVVRGIFSEASLFGFVAYVRIQDLNRLLNRTDGSATDIAVYAKKGVDPQRLAYQIHETLQRNFTVFPLFSNKTDLNTALAENNDGNRLAVLSLDTHLSQIKTILEAFLAVTYFVLVVFVLIIMVGVLNTYRVIVYERTTEIGTMRALGMHRGQVSSLFLIEAISLAILACVLGLGLGLIILRVMSLVDISSIAVAGLVTEQGKLGSYVSMVTIVLNCGIMVAGVAIAAIGPARKAAAIRPAEAMRSDS